MLRKMTVLALAMTIMVAACEQKAPTETPDTPGTIENNKPPVTLTIGHVGHDHQIALGIAAMEPEKMKEACGAYLKQIKEKEVYELVDGDKCLATLKILQVKGGSFMPTAMAEGQIDIGFGGVAAVAKFVDKGQPFKIVAPLHTDGDFLVVKKDSEATDWNSFIDQLKNSDKPIKVGYKASVAVAKLIFVRALTAEGIAWSQGEMEEGAKVIMVNVNGSKNILPTFQSGGIDAFVMNQPVPSIAKIKGMGKIIADLKDLPPEGRWTSHPCCCVATTDKVITEQKAILKTLLKLMAAATDLINSDTDLAVTDASKWTKKPEDVEADSVPGINYTVKPDEEYINGLKVWATLMAEEKQFTGALKDLAPDKVVDRICDMTICQEAIKELVLCQD